MAGPSWFAGLSLGVLLLAIFSQPGNQGMAQESVRQPETLPELGKPLTAQQANSLAALALAGIDREFPNKPSNVLGSAKSVIAPKEMFPAFYGCFDWHSSVHGHWLLVRVLRLYPDATLASEIRGRLAAHL